MPCRPTRSATPSPGDLCARIRTLRARLAAYDERLSYIAGQYGMFSILPLAPAQVLVLREEKGIDRS